MSDHAGFREEGDEATARPEPGEASTLGYAGFYLLLASVGAQGDLRKVVSHPQFILLGVIVIVVHAVLLFAALRA